MDNAKKISILNILVIIFTTEKMIQHLFSAVLFFVKIPGIGTPNIGPNFDIGNQTMGILNLLYFIFLSLGLTAFIKKIKWGVYLIIFLAALDILLEFLFHYFFFITISVIVSSILIILSIQYCKFTHRNQ